jgi:hypothetical protein
MNLYDSLQKRAVVNLDFEHQLRDRDSELTGVRSRVSQLLGELQSRNDELDQLRHQLGLAATIREGLEQQLRDRDSELTEVRSRVNQLLRELQSRNDELAHIYGSWSWRLTRPLRFLRGFAAALKYRGARLASRFRQDRVFGNPTLSDVTKLGASERRVPSLGDATESIGASASAVSARETELELLRRSGLFDEHFYCAVNPDVANANISPFEDFLYVGALHLNRFRLSVANFAPWFSNSMFQC